MKSVNISSETVEAEGPSCGTGILHRQQGFLRPQSGASNGFGLPWFKILHQRNQSRTYFLNLKKHQFHMFAELLGTKVKQKSNWHLLGFSPQASSALHVGSSLIWKVLLAPLYRQRSEGSASSYMADQGSDLCTNAGLSLSSTHAPPGKRWASHTKLLVTSNNDKLEGFKRFS